MKLGTAKIDITPKSPVPLAGFAHRQGMYKKVNFPLSLRVFYFRQGDKEGGKRSFVLIIADVIWWGNKEVERLREKLQKKLGIEKADMIFHATHNHSGPQTTGGFTRSLGEKNDAYIDFLGNRLLRAVYEAKDSLEPIVMERGITECHFGINRRKKIAGKIKMAPNKEGPVDPEVTILLFRKKSGEKKGVLVHYACHPTTTGDNDVTAEFPGISMDYIERSLGGSVIAGFLQGCCGDVRPSLVKEGVFYRGNHDNIKRLGKCLAEKVLKKLEKGLMKSLSASTIESHVMTLPLLFGEQVSLSEVEQINRNDKGLLKEWSESLLNNRDRLALSIPFHISLVKISGCVAFLAMNAEMVVEYGLYIKRHFSDRIIPLPYSNGMIGYVPTANQISEGGYESDESTKYFGLPSSFSPSIEADIHYAIEQLVGKENNNA